MPHTQLIQTRALIDDPLPPFPFPSPIVIAFDQYRHIREPRINAVLSAASAESEQANTTGGFAVGLRNFAAGLMPREAQTAALEKMIGFNAWQPFE
jgi:hypothetical protein